MTAQVQLGTYITGDEEVSEAVETDEQRIVVTDQRVLAFKPGGGGRNYQAVELLNVTGVKTGSAGGGRLRPIALICAILGVPFAAVALLIDFDGMAASMQPDNAEEGAEELGTEGVLDFVGLVAQLDTIFLAVGGVFLLGAVLAGALFWYLREDAIVISVAGEAAVEVPWLDDAESAPDAATAATAVANAVIEERGDDEDALA